MVKMADIYWEEENFEKAYILYLKYLTLFIEKIREHPEYNKISKEEKSKVMKTVKSVMPKSEDLKLLLKVQFEAEYKDYLQMLEICRQREAARAEEERQLKLKLEGENLRKEISKYHDEKSKTLQMQRDLEVAMWHQLKINQEEESNKKADLIVDRSSKPLAEKQIPAIPDRASKPKSMSLYSGSGGQLRKVEVPAMLMAKFMSIADPNTSANIETCGVLTGKLAQNKFKVTHLLIPKQSGTSDSCSTVGEEAIFDYQEKHDLITLGWVRRFESRWCNVPPDIS